MPSNPFLDPSPDIRWTELRPELIEASIDEALSGAETALAAIEGRAGKLTFENTFLALDESTVTLNIAWSRVGHLQNVADSPPLREAYNKVLPRVSAFFARIPLRAPLWAKLKEFAAQPEAGSLTPVRARFLSETVAEFREAGADLPPDGKARLEAIQSELAQVTQKFAENALDSTNAWQLLVEDESRLSGLPANARRQALASAASKGLGTPEKPVWRFTLHQPSLEPFMTYVEDDGLREQMARAGWDLGAVAPYDNTAIITQTLRLRTERSRLLGRENFADLITARRMAKSGARALKFVDDMAKRCAPAFERENRALEEAKAKETGKPAGRLAPWELMYRAERMRRAHYDFDEEALRPYFPMDRVLAGMFELVRRVFGMRVVARAPGEAEVWHPEVLCYDAYDARDRHIGTFYTDWHPRESKRGGAWQSGLGTGGPQPDGSFLPHTGIMCGNMTPPSAGKPALLTHREVETLFHEYGHLMHHMLGDVEIKALSGTNVAWDFVELPSQIMENWTWERESLDLFARHHETGEPIPESLFGKMTAARNFRSAVLATRQCAQGKMDLLLHIRPDEFTGVADVEATLRAAIADLIVPTEPPAPTIIKRFTHLFSDPVGYAAAYYSYKWAEVLEADAFNRFRKEGIFNEKLGREFVEKILSRGNADDAGQLFRDFMGRDPDPEALLVRSGLAA
jgi:oligopeptidase A